MSMGQAPLRTHIAPVTQLRQFGDIGSLAIFAAIRRLTPRGRSACVMRSAAPTLLAASEFTREDFAFCVLSDAYRSIVGLLADGRE